MMFLSITPGVKITPQFPLQSYNKIQCLYCLGKMLIVDSSSVCSPFNIICIELRLSFSFYAWSGNRGII